MVKPDPLLFRLLLERYAIIPETAVFIDDNARNVAAANALGLHGVCFTNPAALRDELQGCGAADLGVAQPRHDPIGRIE